MKVGRGSAPAREISFVSLVAHGPKVFLLRLSHEGLQLLKPGRVVPNMGLVFWPINALYYLLLTTTTVHQVLVIASDGA